MPTMPMSTGSAMSMWMPMPGQTWLGVAASFAGMWTVMTAAMMLPSFAPVLWRYRLRIREAGYARGELLTALIGLGYSLLWMALGVIVFGCGAALAALEMRQPALASFMPIATALTIVLAGLAQLTPWKARALACRNAGIHSRLVLPATPSIAWRHGVRMGLECGCSCAALMTIQLALGMMDLRVMAAVTAAITAERLAPAGMRVARVTGFVAVALGFALLARAAGVT
jgi:predicted metal-binding membrane protein